jgi:hypothetical protein
VARAEYIAFDPSNGRLTAVFGEEVRRAELRPLADNLSRVPRVRVAIGLGSPGEPDAPKRAILVLEGQRGPVTRAAAVRLKHLTRPELSATASSLVVTVFICTCSYVSSTYDVHYVKGLEPQDAEATKLRLLAGVAELPFLELYAPVGHSPLIDALQAILRDLSVFVADTTVDSRPDPNPCTHSI